MRPHRHAFLIPLLGAALLASSTLPAAAADASLSKEDKATINTLLDHISHRKDLTFVRLDKTYDAHTAAVYLRFKWHQNESKVHNVQDFINLSATGGKHGEVTYYVRYPDGHERTAKAVLEEAVAQIEQSTAAAS